MAPGRFVWMSDSLHLAFFIPELAGGGAERVVLTLAGAFARDGHRADLLLTRRRGAFDACVPPDVRVVDFGASRTVMTLPALVRYLRRTRPDVLVTALGSATVVGAAARAVSSPSTALCATVHNLPSRLRQRPGAWRAALLRLLPVALRHADAVVAVSHAVAADLRAEANLHDAPDGTLHVIHNPIDVAAIRDAVRFGADPPHPWLTPDVAATSPIPVVLGVGRLCVQKDFPTLLRAVARLRRQRPVRCIILGEGPERERIDALASDLGLDDAVSMPGFVDDPYAFMARADVFALSSAWEPFGNVVVEAMACGTSVVVTGGAGGASEIVRDAPTGDAVGPVVPPDDPAALAQAIASLLDAPTAPECLQERADAFDVPHAVDAYRRLFDALRRSRSASPSPLSFPN